MLSEALPNAYLHDWNNDARYSYFKADTKTNIEIQPLFCSESSHRDCVTDEFITLKLDNLSPVILHLVGFVQFKGIQFDGGSSLVPNCKADMCTYCPRVLLSGGSYFDDRQNKVKIGDFADQSLCTKFHPYSFINVENSASVILSKVHFVGFRQQLRSLISLTDGSLTLSEVTFRNIQAAKAVILQTDVSFAAVITLQNSTIELLNNGFEYVSDLTYPGFLSISSANRIEINDSTFEFNIVGAVGALISAFDFISISIIRCRFEYNFGRLLSVSSVIALPEDLDASGNLVYFPITHVSVSDSTFNGNSGNSLILILFQGDIQNVNISDCRFTTDLSLSDGLIHISSTHLPSARETEGARLAVRTATSRVLVYFPKRFIIISNLWFEACSVYGSGLIHLSSLANLDATGLTVTGSGDIGPYQTSYEITLKAYIASKGVYMSRPVASQKVQSCNGLLYLNSIQDLTITQSIFTKNVCNSGSVGILALNIATNCFFSDLKFTKNSSVSQTVGMLLDVSLFVSATFSLLSVAENTNMAFQGSGVVRLTTSPSPALIVDSEFLSNTSPSGGALLCIGSCSIERSTFNSNTAAGGTAAALVYNPLPNASSLSLNAVKFIKNSSSLGGALTITDTLVIPAKIRLTILNSQFTKNVSSSVGSCIHITNSVRLTDDSLISKTGFEGNRAAIACINNAFVSGVLVFDDCVFNWNSAMSYSVMYSTNPASTAEAASHVTFQNSLFEYNSGIFVVGFNNMDAFTEGDSKNLTFRHNTGRGFFMQWTFWQETGSIFYNNSVVDTATAFACYYYSQVFVSNTTFVDNKAMYMGSVMYVGGGSLVIMQNCYFARNVVLSQGGAIYVDQQGMLSVYSTEFTKNKALEGAAIYFFVGTLFSQQFFSNCSFHDNESHTGTISFITTNATMVNCSVHDNIADESPGLLVYLGLLTVTGTRFYRQKGYKGAFVAAPASSTVKLIQCSFLDGEASDRGAGVYVSSSTLTIRGSEFRSLTAALGVAIAVYADSNLIIAGTNFIDILSKQSGGGVVFVSESNATISSAVFLNFTNGAVVGQGSRLDVSSTEFRNGTNREGAGITCSDCPAISVLSTICHYLTAQSAACFSLTATKAVNRYTIQKSVFEYNHGETSGAVYIANTDGLIEDSEFVNNTAGNEASGNGGALLLACRDKQYCNVTLSRCTFTGNRAAHNGGGIYWTDFKPMLNDVTFANNSAAYGHNIASFAIRLAPGNSTEKNYTLSAIPSGQSAPVNVSVMLLDHYGQIVMTDSSSLADLLSVYYSNTTVGGTTRVVAINGTFEFTSYEIAAMPGTNTKVKVQTTGIDTVHTQPNETISPELFIDVKMRNCIVGESLFENLCYVCPEGKYSLDPLQSCSECPTGAICLGRATMIPQPGYWRSHTTSNKFWKCPNADACLGSSTDLSQISLLGDCAEGYYGNMCNGCIGGFSRSTKGKCSQCPEQTMNIVQIVGIGVCTLLVLIFVIKMSLVSAQKSSSQHSIYLKIFVNYLQLVSLTAGFDLSWPTYLIGVFAIQENAGNVSEQVFSFDCFISNDKNNSQQNVVFLKVIVVSCLPLLILSVSVLFWGIVSVLRKSRFYMKYHLVNSLTVLFFIAHPSIVKVMFDVFNCKEIDPGEFWMSSYLNIRCWDSEHKRYALGIALPSIVLWGVATPLTALIMLIANRKHLEDLYTRIRFGFLFTGYQIQNYFWEFVILYRKMIIIIFSVFFTTISVPVQALCVMVVLIFAFILQMKQRPFLNPIHNELEQRGILVASITIYCGLFFLTGEIEGPSQFVLFIIILIANVYFLLYWLVQTCRACFNLLIRLIPRLKGVASHPPQRVIPDRCSLNMSRQPLAAGADMNRSASKVIDM